MFYPLLFRPVLKDYLWGGRNLETRFGRILPPHTQIAESWEIAAHPDGDTPILNGPYAGLTLSALHTQLGLDLIGAHNTWAQARGKFPLLVKLLDAQDKLSVQVHPPDDYARTHAGNELGKTEMWVILDATPDAAVILGVRRGADRDHFQRALVAGEVESCLHTLPVRAGDFVCVPAGSLHAILGGVLIAEIQQNSNTTYRVYDWNRLDKNGLPRALHIQAALDVINFDQIEPRLPEALPLPAPAGLARYQLCRNRYFAVERWHIPAGADLRGNCDGSTLEIWGTLAGEVALTDGRETISLPAISFTLLPAALGPFTITAHTPVTLLRVYVPAA